MRQITVRVTDPYGLHARPITVVVNAASRFPCEMTLAYNGRKCNMKSIMGVMSLDVPTQSEITITCSGDGEDAAIAGVADILRNQNIIA